MNGASGVPRGVYAHIPCLCLSLLNLQRLLLLHPQTHLNKLLQRHIILLLVCPADIQRNSAVLRLLISQHENIRSLCLFLLFNLLHHILIGIISLYAYAIVAEHCLDLLRILVVLLTDRDH